MSAAIYQFDHFIDILKAELNRRINIRPKYNRTSFARDLGLTHNRLSSLLSGKAGLSRSAAEKIAKKLRFSVEERQYFCDLADSIHARSVEARSRAQKRIREVGKKYCRDITIDEFKLIADWDSVVLIELLKLEKFRTVEEIAAYFSLDVAQINKKLSTLKGLGLVECFGEKWKATVLSCRTTEDVPSDFIKAFHSKVLEEAKKALFTQDVMTRVFQTSIVSLPRHRVGEAKKRINAFVRDLSLELTRIEKAEDGPKDSVYALAVQLFDTSKSTR